MAQYLRSPDSLPLYEQDYEDTAKKKIGRVGNAAVESAKLVTPFLSTPAALAVNAGGVVWKYGQYGLLSLMFSNEILEGLIAVQKMSQCFQEMESRELLVGVLYLTASQRYSLRAEPDGQHNEAMAYGRPVDAQLLDLLIELAGVGIRERMHKLCTKMFKYI